MVHAPECLRVLRGFRLTHTASLLYIDSMTAKYICSKAEKDFLAKIGKLGGEAVTGEAKKKAGRLGGLASGQARRKKLKSSATNDHD